MGLYSKAEPLYLKNMEIEKKVLGEDHPYFAISLNNMAHLYNDFGEVEKAESYFIKSMALRKQAFGEISRSYSIALNNLGLLYYEQKKYEEALPCFLKCVEIRKEVLGEAHPSYAVSINNLALLYRKLEDYKQAEKYFLESNKIRENVWGNKNPAYAKSLYNLVLLYRDMGKWEEALKYAIPMANLKKDLFRRSFDHLSEADKLKYQQRIIGDFDLIKNLATKVSDEALNAEIYNTLLFEKGILLNSSIQTRNFIYSSAASASKENFSKIQECKKMIFDEQNKRNLDQALIDSLFQIVDKLEIDLAKESSHFRDENNLNKLTTADLKQLLDQGELAIEFTRYDAAQIEDEDSIMYGACILDASANKCHFLPLFEESELEDLLLNELSNFDELRTIYNSYSSESKNLYNLIWRPLESYIDKKQSLMYSPAGLLNKINLNAIAVNDTTIMADKYRMNNMLSTRAISNQERSFEGKTAYVVGDVNYGKLSRSIDNSSKAQNNPYAASFVQRAGDGEGWDKLSWTKEETDFIRKKLNLKGYTTKQQTGTNASEAQFKQDILDKASPRIIHFATHGYFVNDTFLTNQSEEETFYHPMNNSGLVLSNVNTLENSNSTFNDGYLTAFEISQMNLSNTELVVLSACETGLGDIIGSEGVFGLQRAFKMAGVKHIIMTLWHVNDRTAKEFMVLFYENYLEVDDDIRAAFNKAQLTMRDRYPDPYIWAGFILTE